ncbi:MAG: hypothetical protein ACRDZW_01975, partial [Acidimicrobiales bacterium]
VLMRGVRALVSANRPDPLDVAVTTAWILLEILGWAILVVELEWITQKDFLELPTAAVLRLLLAGVSPLLARGHGGAWKGNSEIGP